MGTMNNFFTTATTRKSARLRNHLKIVALSSLTSLCIMSTSAIAETVQVPNATQAAQIKVPSRGITMIKVLQEFGEPESKSAPTGTPPIYYWEYQDFTVYFESERVIHAVNKHQKIR